jgi:hypothetical protein
MNNWFDKLPKKTRIIILVAALAVIAGLWFMAWRTATKSTVITNNHEPISQAKADQPRADKNTNTAATNVNKNVPSDFTKTGNMTFNNPGLKENTPYFVFEEPGSPALSKELIFDENSVCASGAGTLPCLAMNMSLDAAYGDKRVTVSGVSQPDGSLLVKTLSLKK